MEGKPSVLFCSVCLPPFYPHVWISFRDGLYPFHPGGLKTIKCPIKIYIELPKTLRSSRRKTWLRQWWSLSIYLTCFFLPVRRRWEELHVKVNAAGFMFFRDNFKFEETYRNVTTKAIASLTN